RNQAQHDQHVEQVDLVAAASDDPQPARAFRHRRAPHATAEGDEHQRDSLQLGIALMLVAFGGGVGSTAMAKGTRWLRIVGRCSYEIYLFHMLIVLGLIAIVRQLHVTGAFALWYAVMLGGSILSGYLIALGYSEPLNRRIRSASGSISGDIRAPAAQLTTD